LLNSGQPSDFPTVDQWINFNDMWALNLKNTIDQTTDSATDKQAIHDAIVQVSIASKVDARLILAAIIQEVNSTDVASNDANVLI
jgi:hypothetical protein